MSKTRSADYTIEGFLYQFVLTLQKILKSDKNSKIQIEGLIEDIDVSTSTFTEAIQCKYHETKENFTLSSIYKPVLQMMCHFQKHPHLNIFYRLYAHFPNETVGSKKILRKEEVEKILISKDKELTKYISELKDFKNINSFISKFEMEFGASLDNLEKAVIVDLSTEGFSTKDSEEIFYPNSIHKIAQISTIHDPNKRIITRSDFLKELKTRKKTVITRWTKEFKSYEKLLKRRKEQMRNGLNQNYRTRAIILDSDFITNFKTEVVSFIGEFIHKYNSKIKLHKCPLFSVICEENQLNEIWTRLNSKGIVVERGLVGEKIDIQHFLRTPMKSYKEGKSEFSIRLCHHLNDFNLIIPHLKFDDIFIISDKQYDFSEELKDTNIEKIETPDFEEIKYLLSIKNSL